MGEQNPRGIYALVPVRVTIGRPINANGNTQYFLYHVS